MSQLTLDLKFRSPVKELFFILSPSDTILNDVFKFKQTIYERIGRIYESRYSKAHISLFKCRATSSHLRDIIEQVESKAKQFSPFRIAVRGWSEFHHGRYRTSCLDIEDKEPVRQIFNCLTKRDSLHYTPHITIAKKLLPDEFKNVDGYLRQHSYSEIFLCDRILALVRGENRWNHYKDILLGKKDQQQ